MYILEYVFAFIVIFLVVFMFLQLITIPDLIDEDRTIVFITTFITSIILTIAIFVGIWVSSNNDKLNRNSYLYIQKIIVENEDKIERNDEISNLYRVNLEDFFIEFEIYDDVSSGKKDINLKTSKINILKYLNINPKEIEFNEEEIEDGYYKPFKEKYLNIEW